MITIKKSDDGTSTLYGKSTETKPTISFKGIRILNSSVFFEMDTQKAFFYDGDTESWFPQP